MSERKRQTLKNKIIQKEQMQLLKMQKELENILGKVNETINALKIEELQLKSNAVAALKIAQPTQETSNEELYITYEQPSTARTQTLQNQNSAQIVNQQAIDLDMFVAHSGAFDEEMDSD